MLSDLFLSRFRDEFRKALKERAQIDWPIVIAQPLDDSLDESEIAEFAAGTLVNGEPWLIQGVLRSDPAGPPIVARLRAENFPVADVEVTGTVLRSLPIARIRDKALAWLIPLAVGRQALADASGWAITPDDVERARETAAQAERPQRGRRGHPPEHYRRIAFRYLELLKDGQRKVLVALADEESERLGRTIPRETVRDWVRKATRLGFLAPGKRGRAEARPGPNLYKKKEETDG